MENDSIFLAEALKYAALGWHVFPCVTGGKEPAIVKGCRAASTDENQIRAWWTKTPDANIGLLCGPKSGVYVVDVDVNASLGIDGFKSLPQLLPVTVTASTPRGGAHYLFKSSTPPANKNGLFPGVDIRGDGYYIVLAPSIHPNGGTYEWEFGLDPWSVDMAEFPDFCRAKEKKAAPWDRHKRPTTLKPADSPIIERARLYLAQCEPAIQGQAGHDKLLWAARAMVRGFKLSESEALALLWSEFNPRCVPQWNQSNPKDCKDFERKVTEALRTPGTQQDGWLLEEVAGSDFDAMVELGQRIADSLLESESRKKAPKLKLPSSPTSDLMKPPGLVGELAEWIESCAACSQPWLNLGAAITFCGALMGRKVQGVTGVRTNIYTMLVGETSSGKDHARKMLRKLSHEAGCSDMIGAESITSDAAINAQLVKSPSSIYLWDEIGHMFKSMKATNADPALAKVTPHLMTLFSSASESLKVKGYAGNPGEEIDQPNLCFIGTGVPGRLQDGLTVDQVADGFLARILMFMSRDRPRADVKRAKNSILPPPAALIERVRNLYLVQPKAPETSGDIIAVNRVHPAIIEESEQAEAIFDAFLDHAHDLMVHRQEKNKNDLWGKAGELARKLALVVAVGDGQVNQWGTVINEGHAKWACSMVERLIGDLLTIVDGVNESQFEKDKAYVLSAIERAGKEGSRKSSVIRQTRRLTPVSRDMILKDLIESGDVVVNSELTEGRTAVRYFTLHNAP